MMDFNSLSQNMFGTTSIGTQILIVIVMIWSIIWKGFALWKAAHKNDRNWFIALLVINFVGILEILHIYVFSERKSKTPKVQQDQK